MEQADAAQQETEGAVATLHWSRFWGYVKTRGKQKQKARNAVAGLGRPCMPVTYRNVKLDKLRQANCCSDSKTAHEMIWGIKNMERTLRDLYFHLTDCDGSDCLLGWIVDCTRKIHKVWAGKTWKTATFKNESSNEKLCHWRFSLSKPPAIIKAENASTCSQRHATSFCPEPAQTTPYLLRNPF
jgi:hypothetical protein